MKEYLYNLIMHGDSEFWADNKGYVDFPKDRFLEHTKEHIRNQFQSLEQDTINKIKKLPTLFAVEQEEADTKIGKITKIEVELRYLRIYYEFDSEHTPLTKGALQSPELGLNLGGLELYRTHWAIKEANLNDFLDKRKKGIEGIFDEIKAELDTRKPDQKKPKVSILYACNASGKTRLSKLFADQYDEQVIYYNAFTEDLFSWDNENYTLRIDNRAWIFKFIQEQGLDHQIISNFQKLTGSKLEPEIDIANNQIVFGIRTGDDDSYENIKISRGEESIFIWSVFYTVLYAVVNILNEKNDEEAETKFDDINYIVIDDPVSSMDDTRIITVALELAKLISTSKNQLKFLITTHHALFFNVLFNTRRRNWDGKNYVLSKSETDYHLKGQGNDSPFAYHHIIITEIKDAIKNKDIRRYHFNLFRSLLEKTANFLGYENKNKCFDIMTDDVTKDGLEVFKKTLEHYSHNSLWDLEPKNVSELEKVAFEQSFKAFINKFNWGNI